ncbi:hypothetical protein JYQ62_25100 [Nostoc sp. UHCC 0702]|nr:hypothetical protein JYQ62_25100 [Nostoc sp. UHCC 0702]
MPTAFATGVIGNFFPMPYALFAMPKNSTPLTLLEFFIFTLLAVPTAGLIENGARYQLKKLQYVSPLT